MTTVDAQLVAWGIVEGLVTDDGAPVVILGAGLAGLSTAYHLADKQYVLVEREKRVGGKAVSDRREGYTFDITGHWLHVRDDRVERLIEKLFAPGDLVEIERRTAVYSHGVMLPYPFQANLFGLPLDVVQSCLVGFVEAHERAARGGAGEPRTFEEFAVARFGRGIARHFFVPYNYKLWGMHPNRLTPKWVSRYIPVPDVEQVIGGAIGLRQEGLGYNVRFHYPRAGGMDALPEALRHGLESRGRGELHLGAEVTGVDTEAGAVEVAGVGRISYSTLISTLPLPTLIKRVRNPPAAVVDAAARLRCVPWRYLNVATTTPSPMPHHWVYVPEPHIPFFRVGCFTNAVPSMAPPGCASLYVELADRTGKLDLPAVLQHLADMGAITSPADVRFVDEHRLECAYVVFDDAWQAATETIFRWLDEVGVRSSGRYGAWIYNAMQDSIVLGMEAAAWAEGR